MTHLIPFPPPTERMQLVLDDLVTSMMQDERAAPGPLVEDESLPRPWDLTTIDDQDLRWDVWTWLEACAIWLNTQHTWFSQDQIPACWPEHPPLIRELSTLAFQRYEAGEAGNPDALEAWHRLALPAFLERTREQRLGCNETHKSWPGRAEMNRHLRPEAAERRRRIFAQDCNPDEEADTQPLRILGTTG